MSKNIAKRPPRLPGRLGPDLDFHSPANVRVRMITRGPCGWYARSGIGRLFRPSVRVG